jgi:hypothetical protein
MFGMFKNIVKIEGGPEELLRYVNTTIKDRSERDSVRIAKEYQKVIDSKFDERAYNNYKELVKETEIPKDDLQKIETYVMTTPRENRRDIDIYRYWSLKDLSKGWEGKSMPTDDRREMIKRFPKFAKGGKVKDPHPDYPDFVSMQYADGGYAEEQPARSLRKQSIDDESIPASVLNMAKKAGNRPNQKNDLDYLQQMQEKTRTSSAVLRR